MKNKDIVNDNITSKIKETLVLDKISHNMLVENHYLDEFELVYNTIHQFIGRF